VVRLVDGSDWSTSAGSLVASTASSPGGASSADGSDAALWKAALANTGSRNEDVSMQIMVTNLEIQLNELAPGTEVSPSRSRVCQHV
jgi:hypothetical protein